MTQQSPTTAAPRSHTATAATPGPSGTLGQDVPAAWDAVAAGFDAFVTPSGTQIGDAPLRAIGLGPGQRFLDVAAGSGALALAAARLGADVLGIDFSPSMVERLNARAAAAGLPNVRGTVMDGTDLAIEDDTFDAAGSQFGVMLFPDMRRGLRELVRVTKPGGRVIVIALGPPAQVEFLTHFLGALQSVVPGFQGLPSDPPPLPFQLADPSRMKAALAEAGLRDVQIERTTYATEHPTAQHLWNWVTHSNPIGQMLVCDVSPAQKAQVLTVLEDALAERADDHGPAKLHQAINVGIGRV